MKFFEIISIITYTAAIITLVSGLMLSLFLDAASYYYSYVEFLITLILFFIFIVIAAVMKIISR